MNPAATLAIYLAAALGEIGGCFAFTAWLHHYNHHRPHGALDHQPPVSRLPTGTTW